ncbi:MAG: carboxylating nicotinate-nucleotide diphosphorylase [Paludibacteraceae bacterium]|nr:carboxylating nicotinate-nucleotide diphosphorylase [Paludibacteraceae bacterium]
MSKNELNTLIEQWFKEDIGDGDHTSLSSIPADVEGCQQLILKDTGILAGVEVAKAVIEYFDPTLRVEWFLQDGASVKPGDIAFRVYGKVRSLLQVERTMLNIMQRMSGIATMSHYYQQLVEGTGCTILDTRKTTPGLRLLEKEAVRIGGAHNHRIGLFDMILLKDNHVDFAGGTAAAIHRAKEYCKANGKDLKIEIEVRNQAEIDAALAEGGIDRIMLDNFTPADTKWAVQYIRERTPKGHVDWSNKVPNWKKAEPGYIEIESSGGITKETLRDYAECGVDFISVGALTHSFKCLDMSFKAYRPA